MAISFAQAALGTRVIGAHPDRRPRRSRSSAGTQPGDTVVLRGRGLPRLRERGQGDLHVHFRLLVPRELSEEQETRLRAFAELDQSAPTEPPEAKRGLFGRRRKS